MKKTLLLLSLFTILCSCGSDDDTQSQPEISPFDYTQEEKDAEIAWIENYIKENNIEGMTKSDSGLFYRIDRQGDGLPIQEGYNVLGFVKALIAETGELVSNTNRELFPIGQEYQLYLSGPLYAGMREGFTLLNEGGKATVIIPSFLELGKQEGYGGHTSNGLIPPETILIKEIEPTYITRTPN
jgi:FKBP-type peptidyl-prolyl cis-trans isomerase